MPKDTVEAVDRARSSSGQSTGLRGQCSPGRAPQPKCRVCDERGHRATKCPLAIAALANPGAVPSGELARIRMEQRCARAADSLRVARIPEDEIAHIFGAAS